MKKIILLVLAGCLLVSVQAIAGDSTLVVKQFMQQVQQAYKSASYLSFHVVYRYANKDNPGQYFDTMSGEVALHKNHMRFVIEGTEMLTNDTYSMQVNNEDKLIYLSTPQPSQMADPVAVLDSALAQFEGIRTRVTNNKGMATLTLSFPPGQTYKNIIMVIDEKTGFFKKVVYEMYTSELVEKDQLIGEGGNGLYQNEGNVEILFSDYAQGQFTDELFDEKRFFNRLAKGKYEPSEKYKDYQIFLASPKL
ncbi:hypothetical protein [Niastella sp. OAS944]|uniref:hypothetical protein n=1 Tax=Niastella sp. OAS944 TaxID=2664089 RepID=UPI0034944CC8|nr:outer membrane lipoprotein-sorting protein [Chitinophagaceae bacterium OAS944]